MLRRIKTGVAFYQNPLTAASNDVFYAERHQEFCNGNACRARAVDNDVNIFNFFVCKLERVQKRRRRNDRRTVLIVVENGNIQLFFQSRFNFKTTGRGNVFQIHAAKRACQQLDRLDNLFRIFRTNTERISVYVAERLKQRALTFHNGHTRFGADIPKAKHRRTVGNNGNGVPTTGEIKTLFHVFVDCQTRFGNAGGIRQGQMFSVLYAYTGYDFDFTFPFAV